jgi:hypothetical protein
MTHEGALTAWKTRRNRKAWGKAHQVEKDSKNALEEYCQERGWYLAFFEGPTGAPRTGIIDAIAYRLGRHNPDKMDLRLIQPKGGKAGVTAEEIGRLKKAARGVDIKFLIAEFDGKRNTLELLPDELETDDADLEALARQPVVKARRI